MGACESTLASSDDDGVEAPYPERDERVRDYIPLPGEISAHTFNTR